MYTPDEFTRKFSHALFPRTTNRYGCVTLHSYHFSIAEGLPQTRVLLWVYGEQLRAVLDNVVLAAYHCRYDWRTRKGTDIRDGVWYATRFASPQTSLLSLNAQETLALYRPRPVRSQAACLLRHSNYGSSNWSLQGKIRLFPHWGNGCLGHVS